MLKRIESPMAEFNEDFILAFWTDFHDSFKIKMPLNSVKSNRLFLIFPSTCVIVILFCVFAWPCLLSLKEALLARCQKLNFKQLAADVEPFLFDPGDKKKILLIEDDPFISEMYTTKFEKAGYEVEVAMTGKDGVTQAGEFKPDIVLCDILIPEMDGFEVLSVLKKNPVTKNHKR